MRIGVVGAGAMGGLFGGCLTEAGHDVTLIDRPGPHLEAMRTKGLRLRTDKGDRRVRVQAGVAAEFTAECDLLIVFTKGPQTEVALRAAGHLAGPRTWVLTVQNGLGNAERILAALPQARVLIGMTSWPADLTGPGHVLSHGHGEVRIWPADGQEDPELVAIAGALTGAGLNAIADPAVEVAIWEKVAFNAAMNSVCAVSRLVVGQVGDSAAGRALVRAVVHEAAQVAQGRGIAVSAERVLAAVDKAFDGHRSHQPSMLQDVLARRPTEIEQINGAIVAAGDERGIPTPTTRVLCDLVRLVDSAAQPRMA